MVMFTWLSWDFAAESWDMKESLMTTWRPPAYWYKTVIPVSSALILIQGIAEVLKCFKTLRTGIDYRHQEAPSELLKALSLMSDEILGLAPLGLLFVVILGGFPISFTLIFLGMVFGYIGLGDRVFHPTTYQVFGTMMDTVLAAVAMFTFMGYVLESAGLMRRLFHAVQLLCGRMHGSLYCATILTATLFAAATGIVGASVTIIALMAAPVMLKAGYDVKLSAGTICAGGTLGILIPPSVMLVVTVLVLQVSVARLYRALAARAAAGRPVSDLYYGACLAQPEIRPPCYPMRNSDVPGQRARSRAFFWADPSSSADPRHARLDRLRLGHADRGRGAWLRRFADRNCGPPKAHVGLRSRTRLPDNGADLQ